MKPQLSNGWLISICDLSAHGNMIRCCRLGHQNPNSPPLPPVPLLPFLIRTPRNDRRLRCSLPLISLPLRHSSVCVLPSCLLLPWRPIDWVSTFLLLLLPFYLHATGPISFHCTVGLVSSPPTFIHFPIRRRHCSPVLENRGSLFL